MIGRPLRVVALDLSLRSTGIARTHTADGRPWLSCATIAAPRSPNRTTDMDHARLHRVFGEVRKAAQSKPDVVVVEWLPQFSNHGDASLRLAELHGITKHWLWAQGIPYVDVRPVHLQIYATGRGGATKEDVKAAAIARYGSLPLHIGTEDEADAATLLAMALDAYGQPLAEVPPEHRRAVAAVDWPDLEARAA